METGPDCRRNCAVYYMWCMRRNLPYFRRMFLRLNYIDITKHTETQNLTVMEIMTR
jgi:hypothetical protein